MSQHETMEPGWVEGELRSLHYYSWMLVEEKRLCFLLLLVIVALTLLVWQVGGNLLLSFGILILLLFSIWRTLVPIHFEINADGIARWNFARRRMIPWSEIQSYEFHRHGVLLLPHRSGYPLDAFRGIFVPFPPELEEELKYRLKFFCR